MQTFSKCPLCGKVNEHGATKVIEVRLDQVRRFMCEQHIPLTLAAPQKATVDAPELKEVA